MAHPAKSHLSSATCQRKTHGLPKASVRNIHGWKQAITKVEIGSSLPPDAVALWVVDAAPLPRMAEMLGQGRLGKKAIELRLPCTT